MIISLVAAFSGLTDLDIFAENFFSAIDVSVYEERESSNYYNGYYFCGVFEDIRYEISLVDEDGYDEFPFYITAYYYKSDRQEDFVNAVDTLFKEKLVSKGFHIARVVSPGLIGKEQIIYY